MGVPASVAGLAERFHEEKHFVKSSTTKEHLIRRAYIDPLFSALGWDVDYEKGAPLVFREVVEEDSLRVEGAMKAPDYGFYVGGQRKFFVEAKKPSVNLLDGRAAAFQLRRYGWSAKLPLSILTDFEEFAVYDCRVRPRPEDDPSTARNMYVTYEEYPERWDEIEALFSREAVLSGSLEAYVQEEPKKRGTNPVDEAFLKEIEGWREMLAREIYGSNPWISRRDLNYAVQMTIDRIVFLRTCEDRGIEEYGRLARLLDASGIYGHLCEMFRDADDRYNSGLFHFKKEPNRDEPPDDLTLAIALDDEPLKQVVRGLYYPESPYQFSVMPVEILGQVYERFLGKVITLAPDHEETVVEAVVEEKPEVRKAGGVFYTPSYIVDSIVEQTVGKLLEGKTPRQASKLKILDPACGSGSFLIGAYDYLLTWHIRWYVADGPEKHADILYEGPGGEWRLRNGERKRILRNNVFGVDIDPQAVEVTKLSLLLKVLEGETSESIESQLTLFHERALPDLAENIKWGNSLIGGDFYDKAEMTLLDEEEEYRINIFDWKVAFPEVFDRRDPGFDAVIGNPPYIRIQALKEFAPVEVDYYKEAYRTAAQGNYDIYVVFVEKGLFLLRKGGSLGFILPHKFFNAKYGRALRGLISEGDYLDEVVHFGDEQVFSGATTYTCLMFLNRAGEKQFRVSKVDDLLGWRVQRKAVEGVLPAEVATGDNWNFVVGRGAGLFTRLSQMPVRLGDVAHIFVGLQTSADRVYILEEVAPPQDGLVGLKDRDGDLWWLETEALRPFLNHVTVSAYDHPDAGHRLIFPYRIANGNATLIPITEMASRYPQTWKYLKHNSTTLRARESGKADHDQWYGYIYRKNLTSFDSPKLIVQVISLFGRYSYDDEGLYFTGGGNGPYYGIRWSDLENRHSLHYLQGVLNSRLSDFYLYRISTTFRGGYWSYGKRYIEQLPIRIIDFSDPHDHARHDQMVLMVQRMMDLHRRLSEARTSTDKDILQRQIDATDRQIDRLVYELYDLTDEEILIIEEETAIGS